MKRLLFFLTFFLVASISFANDHEVPSDTPLMTQLSSSVAAYPDPSFFDCTIRGKVTIIFNDGTTMTLKDVQITFVGVSCAKLLKELMEAS